MVKILKIYIVCVVAFFCVFLLAEEKNEPDIYLEQPSFMDQWILDPVNPIAHPVQSMPKETELSESLKPEAVKNPSDILKKPRAKKRKNFLYSSRQELITPSSVFKHSLWKGETEFYWIEDQSISQLLLKVKNYLKVDHHFSDLIHLNTKWLLTIQQGSTQILYARRKDVDDSIKMLSLNVGYKPIENLDIRAGSFDMNFVAGYESGKKSGAIQNFNQSFFSAPLLVSEWSFIGLTQKWSWKPSFLSHYVDDMFFLFRQTIPSGTSELDRFSQVQDLPNFLTGTIFARDINFPEAWVDRIKLAHLKDKFLITANMTGFYFRNLSADMALRGRLYGNTVIDIYSGGDSEFEYSFYGIHTSAGIYFNLVPNLDVDLKTSFLWNFGAVANKNKAQNLYLGLYMPLSPILTFIPNVEYFVNQSDASVAYYNTSKYGNSGNTGYILGLKLRFDKYKVLVDVKYGAIRSISYARSPVGHSNYFKFSVGMDYGKI